MDNLEDEVKDLREKNTELVKKVQYWMMTAAERQTDKLNLMKENNELRLKLGRYRNKMDSQARTLESTLQSSSEKALALLVRASSEIARTMEITKTFMTERQETEVVSPRWSTISGTPIEKRDKVHRVPPLMVGGQSIQPVVALSRTLLNTSNPRSTTSSPSQRNVTQRPLPMHMLQDVYIPLMRIDADTHTNNMEVEEPADGDDSSEQIPIEDDSQRISEEDDYDNSRRLDIVIEDTEPASEASTSPRADNPLEGPSWLLDAVSRRAKPGVHEPDSTTEPGDDTLNDTKEFVLNKTLRSSPAPTFSPTVRRRKRTVSPHRAAPAPPPPPPPLPPNRRNSTSGRVLKVLVAKMRLEGEGGARGGGGGEEGGGASAGTPPAKRASFLLDAPSPNGATVPGVIVSEREETMDSDNDAGGGGGGGGEPSASRCAARDTRTSRDTWSRSARDTRDRSTSGERSSSRASNSDGEHPTDGRTRRARKQVIYKEIPLNRKMRR